MIILSETRQSVLETADTAKMEDETLFPNSE